MEDMSTSNHLGLRPFTVRGWKEKQPGGQKDTLVSVAEGEEPKKTEEQVKISI